MALITHLTRNFPPERSAELGSLSAKPFLRPPGRITLSKISIQKKKKYLITYRQPLSLYLLSTLILKNSLHSASHNSTLSQRSKSHSLLIHSHITDYEQFKYPLFQIPPPSRIVQHDFRKSSA